QVSGRMDGFYDKTPPRIEEIKSAFNVHELRRKLEEQPTHPYLLQLRTYGYFYRLEHQIEPELTLHLVSSRNFASDDLEVELDVAGYESWLELRLAELVHETRLSEKRAERRRKIAADFAFPFESPRPGQVELIQKIDEG